MKDTAKTILCYGDSNTWGAIPRSDDRYPRSVRWPGKLQTLLGDDYKVINEGLNGRTLVAVDPKKLHRTGITHLRVILETADPIDRLIIMLGTNDIKSTYNLSAEGIASHLEQTITLVKENDVIDPIRKIIVICPPSIINPTTNDLDERVIRGIEIFKTLPALYKQVAEKYDCDFINAGEYISSSSIDGYHLDANAHMKLAEVVKEKIG